jgi:cysteine synthase A
MLTDNILDLIGRTPLVHLKGESIFAKAEFLNPGGSIKDRVALAMIEGAERDHRLRSDSIIVEPSSGNTGIGLALVCVFSSYADTSHRALRPGTTRVIPSHSSTSYYL